jgi:glucosyl-dolichyl phosphate glucuronosyltransferase
VSVIICAYTERRWQQTCAAVMSALGQHPQPAEVLLVVDHNAGLAARARRELAGVTVLDSEGIPGLSGARNTGLRAATHRRVHEVHGDTCRTSFGCGRILDWPRKQAGHRRGDGRRCPEGA